MNTDSSRCILTWKLESNEFVILPNKSLRETYRNVTISSREYFVNARSELFTCVPSAVQPPFYLVDLIYACVWMISVFFLTMSIVIHYAQSKIPLKGTRLCFEVCLVAYYMTSILYVISQSDYLTWYYFVTYFGTYANLAALCWLTVINFEKFKRLRPVNLTKPSSAYTFRVQSLIAWCVPLIIIGFTSALRFFGVINNSGYLELRQNNAEVIFFDGSFDIMFVLNLAIFIMTVRNIFRYRKSIAEGNQKVFRKISVVYLELMAVTGLNWIFSILDRTLMDNRTSSLVWTSIGIVSGLQGFFVFLVYHCKFSKLSCCELCSDDNVGI